GRAGTHAAAVGRADAAMAARAGPLPARAAAPARGCGPLSLDRPASTITGVRYGAVQRFADQRGSFRELWRASRQPPLTRELAGLPDARFVQANLSTSAPGVLRGLHYHRRQLDYWVVASGRAFVGLVDVRPAVADGPRAGP